MRASKDEPQLPRFPLILRGSPKRLAPQDDASRHSAQHAIQRGQPDNHGGCDQGVADGAKQRLAGTAEQCCAEGDADAIDRTDHRIASAVMSPVNA